MKIFLRSFLTTFIGNISLGMLAAIVLFTFCIVDNAEAEEMVQACRITAKNMLVSCEFGAEGEYWLAIAKCNNIPDTEKRGTCRSNALKKWGSGIEECQAQFEVRLEICEVLGEHAYNPVIKPADFVDVIDNPFFPLKPGTTFIYEGETEDGTEHIEVKVTHRTKKILGVTCTEVRDTVTVDDEVVEDTLDWYAQDKEGNVWYFGENSKEFEDGLIVSLAGSWTAGAYGAKPGIIMKANPQVGDLYRQEFSLGVAEDMAKVLSLDESARVPYGSFSHCLKTREFAPLEPDAKESKFYARGIGFIKEINVVTGEHVDLIDIKTE